MSRKNKLLALLAVLAVLCIASFAATKLTAESATADTTEEESVSLVAVDAQTVTDLSWSSDEGEFDFRKTENGWQYVEDAAFPADSTQIDVLLSALNGVVATKTIENAEDLAQYGLDAPACTITVTDGGSTVQLVLGDETQLDGARYCSVGDGNVYIVDASIVSTFSCGLYDLVQKETLPDMSDVVGLSIANNGETLTLVAQDEDEQIVWLAKTEDEDIVLDADLVNALTSELTGFAWGDCVAYNAAASVMDVYGLGEDACQVTITYADEDGAQQVFTLNLGIGVDGYAYACIAGSEMVYRVDDALVTAMQSATVQTLQPDETQVEEAFAAEETATAGES